MHIREFIEHAHKFQASAQQIFQMHAHASTFTYCKGRLLLA